MGRCLCSRKCVDRKFVTHLCALCFLTFIIILPICCQNFRHSIYNFLQTQDINKERDIMRRSNDVRLKTANEFLVKYNSSRFAGTDFVRPGPGGRDRNRDVTVGITVITVSRNNHQFDSYEPNYLTQITAKFLQLLAQNRDSNISYELFLCNVDEYPENYHEFNRISTMTSLKTFQKTSKSDASVVKLEKEKRDYIYCAQEALDMNVSYVFLVEDDALPYDDVLSVTNLIIKRNIEPKKLLGTSSMYFKFFHPQHVLGYINLEVERLPELASASAVLATILLLIYKIVLSKSVEKVSKSMWLGFFLYSCALLLSIGRPHLMELRRISKFFYQVTPAPSCCTPAILYTREAAKNLVAFLQQVTCREFYAKDMALDDFRVKMNVTGKHVQPNLFEHIGMYSSLRSEVLNPYTV